MLLLMLILHICPSIPFFWFTCCRQWGLTNVLEQKCYTGLHKVAVVGSLSSPTTAFFLSYPFKLDSKDAICCFWQVDENNQLRSELLSKIQELENYVSSVMVHVQFNILIFSILKYELFLYLFLYKWLLCCLPIFLWFSIIWIEVLSY